MLIKKLQKVLEKPKEERGSSHWIHYPKCLEDAELFVAPPFNQNEGTKISLEAGKIKVNIVSLERNLNGSYRDIICEINES